MTVIKKFSYPNTKNFSDLIQQEAITTLESGNILLFRDWPFQLSTEEQHFLSPQYAHPKSKNICFDLNTNHLHGAVCNLQQEPQLKLLLKNFSLAAKNLIEQLFPHYQHNLKIGRTSLRTVEIKDRKVSFRKDDSRLHVDAFPATPNQGQRILRVFMNVNPHGHARVWRTGESFKKVAERFLPLVPRYHHLRAKCLQTLRMTKSLRTEYDHIMLHIHDTMKADLNYQKTAEQTQVEFKPGEAWIVQTDQVSHAAMIGQHMLEQTFYLPVAAMQNPEHSPLQTLQKLIGRQLI